MKTKPLYGYYTKQIHHNKYVTMTMNVTNLYQAHINLSVYRDPQQAIATQHEHKHKRITLKSGTLNDKQNFYNSSAKESHESTSLQ